MTLRILASNLHDQGQVSSTSEAMPAAYTQRSERPLVWRSADLNTHSITVTNIAGYVDCIALARHNLGANGSFRVELMLGGSVVRDSGILASQMLIPAGLWRAGIDPWGGAYNDRIPGGSSLSIFWLDQPIAIDSYRITLSSTALSGYFEIGRIFSGLSFSPTVNMNYGLHVAWQESGEHIATEGGSLRTVGASDLRRQFSLQLDWLAEIDRQNLVTELVRVGKSADLLVSLYPKSGDLKEVEHTIVCRRVEQVSHQYSHYQNWQSALVFKEV